MDSPSNFQLKQNALQIIQNYRVPDLQVDFYFLGEF